MTRPLALFAIGRALILMLGGAGSAGAATTEFLDYGAFLAATRNIKVVTFDNLTTRSVLEGRELPGLTITARRITVVNPQNLAPGLAVGGANVNSQPNGLSASLYYSSSGTISFDNLDDNLRFDLHVPARAAGIWIGNVGASNNDPRTPTHVYFLDENGETIADEIFTQGHEGQIGTGANNRFFYGIVSDAFIGAISTLNASSDGDGIIFDDVLWAEPIARQNDITVDFGPAHGLWMRANYASTNGYWLNLHGGSPTRMARGDIDGDGTVDLIASFNGSGVWTWRSDTGWRQLHPSAAADIVTGDLDGNGRADIVLSLPDAGLWVRYNDETWRQLHSLAATVLATGNVDNDSGHMSDLIVAFAGYGVYTFANNATWYQVHELSASDIQSGDLDGNGQDDIVLNFPGQGIWIRSNTTGWSQLDSLNSAGLTIGNIDGDAQHRKDIVINFAGYSLYAWLNSSSWTQLHSINAPVLASADLDGNGKDDVLMDFSGYGVWLWLNNSSYELLHSVDAEAIAVGEFDGN